MNRPPLLETLPGRRAGAGEALLLPNGCVDDAALQRLADERDDLGSDPRSALLDHVEACTECGARWLLVRRFRTALLRSRVPGLSTEQWRALDERMALLGSEPAPRAISLGARAYWGLAVAAGTAALVVGGWQFAGERTAAADGGQLAEASGTGTAAEITSRLRVRGDVTGLQVDVGDGHWQALREGSALPPGTLLRSGAAPAALALGDGERPNAVELGIAAETEVVVEQANGSDVFVRVRRGTVELAVAHRRADQRFAVLAGGHRVWVVGTRFSVHHGADASVEVRVFEGAVRVDAAAGATSAVAETTVVVRAGQRWRVRGGQVAFGPMEAAEGAGDGAAATPGPLGALSAEPNDLPAAGSPTRAGQRRAAEGPRPAAASAESAVGAGASPSRNSQAPGAGVASQRVQSGQEPRQALPDRRADVAPLPPTAPGSAARSYVIELPPQAMTPEEIARARALELHDAPQKSRSPAPPVQREAPTSNIQR